MLQIWEWIVNVLNGNNPYIPGQVAAFAALAIVADYRAVRRDEQHHEGLKVELHDAIHVALHPTSTAEEHVAEDVVADEKKKEHR